MRKLFLLIMTFATFTTLQAQTWTSIRSATPTPAVVSLISSDISTSVLQLKLDGYAIQNIQTSNGIASLVSVKGTTPIMLKGAPDLTKITASVIIPDNMEMQVDVLSSSYVDFTNISVAPSKGNLFRNIDPSSVPYTYGSEYTSNAFYPGKLTELRNPYILRDYRGQTAVFYPFQYNPVSKVLRVYTDITIKISAKNSTSINALFRTKPFNTVDVDYKEVYKTQFLNFGNSRYTPVTEEGNMLILSYGPYMAAMQSFVNWKNISGRPTEIVDIATIGANEAAIKTYVTNYYNTKGLTYLLLVGDAQYIPAMAVSSGASDNAYGYLAGGDSYPELFVGRFSAESVTDVRTQVLRTLSYEMNPNTANGWLNKGICIGSDLGGNGQGDNGETDFLHQQIIRSKLLGYTFGSAAELFDGNQGVVDAPGNPVPADLATEINAGAGIITYTGHGDFDRFITTDFAIGNVPALTNFDMLPFIWSVACLNGNFVGKTCFAEALTRANSGGKPIGAVATFMSTINQSWNPPMRGQDEMVAILTESYANNIKRTFGGISMNGCMNMNDVYTTDGAAMTDTWTCFGDPSLMIRTDTPRVIVATHNPSIILGASQLTVNCDVEGALITLSINGQIIGKSIVVGGIANISFTSLANIDTITVVATAYNHTPYIGYVAIIPPSGPYVIYNSHIRNDVAENNNGQADFGETILLNLSLKNIGVSTATNINAILSSIDPYVSITDSTASYGDMDTNIVTNINNAYSFTVADSIPDQHIALFSLKITDGTTVWNSQFSILLNAPVLGVGTITINDNVGGNGNGRLDPGETVQITIPCLNNGHSLTSNVGGALTSTSSYITVNNPATVAFDTLSTLLARNAVYSVTINNAAQPATNVDFYFTLTDQIYSVNFSFIRSIGIVAETFETGDFTNFPWTLSAGQVPWHIDSVTYYEGSNSAVSGNISDGQYSEISMTANFVSTDTLSFYHKESCEAGSASSQWWDYMEFSVDNVSKGKWDGQTNWQKAYCILSTGLHQIKWVYLKDGYVSAGSDCAWIDNVVFPPMSVVSSVNKIIGNVGELVCYPNPSSSVINFNYSLANSNNVELELYSVTGKCVAKIVNAELQGKGFHSTSFDASQLNAGIYYCRLKAGDSITMKKISVLH